ncbi:8-oxo-dGTP diphosphatase [Belliella buryatensis]|uniref:8-oxo-dGTP diphosphatase n=1 Tax=Belliella buryatensis TaxID=1500549 RepID=A0A239F683_9BACT|nr:(deoxy)nucleoside triphosphate pyrophosphohydrolase [Belliella buryatensis]SNS51604.1 8-oxo-dGTP diphosphatase [Belliella buryatensis]
MSTRIQVTCAIIFYEGKILCAQRGQNMSHALKWEFPGGKIETGESQQECIKREIKEELNLEIEPIQLLQSNFHQYQPDKEIELIPFVCRYIKGKLILKEHKKIVWLRPCDLSKLDWAQADIPIVAQVQVIESFNNLPS